MIDVKSSEMSPDRKFVKTAFSFTCLLCGTVTPGSIVFADDGKGWDVVEATPETCPGCDNKIEYTVHVKNGLRLTVWMSGVNKMTLRSTRDLPNLP